MKDDELAHLIARCALRDQHALKQLYDRLSPWLNAIAFRILKSSELSNDVLQEAFVQIWNNASSYRPDKGKPLTWICSILRYRALDRLKNERKHSDRLVNHDDLHALDDYPAENSLEDTVHKEQVSSHIEKCLQALSQRTSNSLRLAYLYGYSREELAVHFDTPINTIKSWLRRGCREIERMLGRKNMKEPNETQAGLAFEYVAQTLSTDERADYERLLDTSHEERALVAFWQEQLLVLDLQAGDAHQRPLLGKVFLQKPPQRQKKGRDCQIGSRGPVVL